MKKIVFPKYGSPDVLQLVEVEPPLPKDHQVLVKVYAASANPMDWHRMRGKPFIARVGRVSTKPKIRSLGGAGRVEAVGKNVTEFHRVTRYLGCARVVLRNMCVLEKQN